MNNVVSFIIILLIYILISLITYIYSKNNAESFKKSFFSSFLALLLTPLFFESIGNNLLKEILDGSCKPYDYMLFTSYATIISLAGRKVIENTLANFNLNDIKEKVENQGSELKEQKDIQKDIIEKQVISDILLDSNPDLFIDFLLSIKGYQEKLIDINSKNIEMIRDLEKKRYINLFGELKIGNIHCSITKIGIIYLDEINR
jgi:hypothetical protein